jgi:hypothetical protein
MHTGLLPHHHRPFAAARFLQLVKSLADIEPPERVTIQATIPTPRKRTNLWVQLGIKLQITAPN